MKTQGEALPETIENTLLSFGGVEEGGMEKRGEDGSAGLTNLAACQCNLSCVPTRAAD